MKYKNAEETAENDVLVTSGPIYSEENKSLEKQEFAPSYMHVSKSTDNEDKFDGKMIVIKETNGSLSFSIDDNWAAYEAIGALEMVKQTVLNKVNPQTPSIMDRILMNSGIN